MCRNIIDDWINSERNPLKKILKIMVRKSVEPLVKMIEIESERGDIWGKKTSRIEGDLCEIFEQIRKNGSKIQCLEDRLSNQNLKMDTILEDYQKQIDGVIQHNIKYENSERKVLGAIARELTRTYWGLIDFMDKVSSEEISKDVECPICGHLDKLTFLKTEETDCIFGGGHLVRYQCPVCGGIFGPIKFSKQQQTEMDDDYVINYTGYREADSTNYEVETFLMLKPSKEGIYLNYGCGVWAETLQKLNEEGYQVYGYEPYAIDVDNPYIINDIEVLKKMRFDGIFSHDLLEHLKEPVKDLVFMKSLLKGVSCKMAHATACYRYKFEYTRFHTAFFTGNSVEFLCKRAGLKMVDYIDDGKDLDFICYVFGVSNLVLPFTNSMQSTQYRDTLIVDKMNEKIFGPYLNLTKGKYRISVEVDTTADTPLFVTSQKGDKCIEQSVIRKEGVGQFDIYLEENEEDIEFVITSDKGQTIQLKSIGFV